MQDQQRKESTRNMRTVSILVALLAIPAVYVAARWPSRAVHADRVQRSSTPPVDSLDRLEALAKSQPTVAHRIDLSQAFIQQRLYGRAIDVLTPLVAEAPGNAAAWNNLCVARTLQMEYNLAIEACQRGMGADAKFELLHNNLRWAQGERDKTITSLADLEKTEPGKRDAAFYLSEGLLHLHLGDYAQAIQAWKRTLQLDPKSATAWNNIGTAQMMQKNPAGARASFLQASALDPTSQLIRNNLAWANGTTQAH